MATQIEVGILGLGRIGTSFGLALKRYNASKDAAQQFRIVGYDPRAGVSEKARLMGALDSSTRSLYDAAQNAAILILALPYASVQPAYREIASAAKPGTVIIDLTALKSPSLAWADKALPAEVHMVGATPILNPAYLFDGLDDTDHARVDLFDKGSLLIMPSLKCAPDAVELVSGLCQLLGITPRFADPDEHDGWAAATEGLPALLGMAAFFALTRSKSWSDAQRQGNNAFGQLVHHLYDTHPDDLRDLLLNNRANLVRQIDQFSDTLDTLRDVLASNDRAALEEALIETTDAAHLWVVNRHENKWDGDDSRPKLDARNAVMSTLFGSFLTKRLRGEKK